MNKAFIDLKEISLANVELQYKVLTTEAIYDVMKTSANIDTKDLANLQAEILQGVSL